MIRGPEVRAEHPVWHDREGAIEVRFVGRGPLRARSALLRAVAGGDPELAWLEQVHSARVVAARPGACGRGDGLFTRRPLLALAVAAADCVPVVVGGGDRLAAVHAGWRGIAAGVVAAAVARIAGEGGELVAWIGPAIGPCCYEVGPDVARRVAAASAEEVVVAGEGDRPRLDLALAVELQLASSGVGEVRRVALCTRCHPELLWSYRGQGDGAGRNLAFAWLADRPRPVRARS